MTAVDLPEEPPVGTTLTAPQMSTSYARTDKGWYTVGPLGSVMFPGLPGLHWSNVVRNLNAYGGILTVTTEYRIEYRVEDGLADEVKVQTGFVSREHIARYRRRMADTCGVVEILRVQSQEVTRSAWTDVSLEDPT